VEVTRKMAADKTGKTDNQDRMYQEKLTSVQASRAPKKVIPGKWQEDHNEHKI